eukprot:681837-Pleurochrysis_carterae.AAC.1
MRGRVAVARGAPAAAARGRRRGRAPPTGGSRARTHRASRACRPRRRRRCPDAAEEARVGENRPVVSERHCVCITRPGGEYVRMESSSKKERERAHESERATRVWE